jgi:starch-binding outer membrane protein, SusD/RagB family
MNTKYLIGFVLAATFITPACNKKLDQVPQNSLTADQIKASGDVEAILFGGYNNLQAAGNFGESYLFAPDLIAGDSMVDFVGTFTNDLQLETHKAVATNATAVSVWAAAYKTILSANTVLDKINVVDTIDRPTVQGEALFMRGTSYFYLAGLFGLPYSDGAAATNLGVPLVVKPTYVYNASITGPDHPARATVADTYTQAVNDLKLAITLLPTSNDNFRADVWAAHAMLSRVYLNMGDYADAAAEADAVIESGNYNLTSTFDKAFNNDVNSPEDVFDIQQTSQSNAGISNSGLPTFYAARPTGRGDAQVDPDYALIFDDPNDFRAGFFYNGSSISGFTGIYTGKWAQIYKAIPVVRLAEMYLTRGEANLMTGSNVGGVSPADDLNIVRERSGAADIASPKAQDFANERFRELGFEGDRFWTVKRFKMTVYGLSYDDPKMIMPIPQSEMDVNSNLKQNQGY